MTAEKKANPGRARRHGRGFVRGHSPALTRLSLVGLLLSRAQLRFAGHKEYTTEHSSLQPKNRSDRRTKRGA